VRKSALMLLIATSLILSTGMAKADLQVMKSKFDVSLYGYIKGEMIYHSARATSTNYLVFAYPDVEPFNKQHTMVVNARQTRLGFNIAGPGPSAESKVLGNIEFDFYGSGFTECKEALMLRRASVTLKYPKWNLLAGQEWMLMSPLYPHTSNYPAGVGLGNLGYRMPQIRLTIGDQIRGAISVGRKIEGDFSTGDFDAGAVSAVPDTQIQLGYWGKNGLVVALSGHYAEEKYTLDPKTPFNPSTDYFYKTEQSWSANLSINIPIGKKLAIDGEAYYGANLDGGYTGNILGEGVGVQANGTIVPVHDVGGWVEIMAKPVKKLTIYVGFGEDDPLNSDLRLGPFTNSYNKTLDLAALAYNVTPITFPSSLGMPGGIVAMTLNQMIYGHFIYDITDALKVSLEVMLVNTQYHNQTPNHDGSVLSSDVAFWYYF